MLGLKVGDKVYISLDYLKNPRYKVSADCVQYFSKKILREIIAVNFTEPRSHFQYGYKIRIPERSTNDRGWYVHESYVSKPRNLIIIMRKNEVS